MNWILPLALVLGVLFTLGAVPFDTEVIDASSELETVSLGIPFGYLVQDQRYFSPPLPWRMGMCFPKNCPTTIRLAIFVIDVLLNAMLVSFITLACVLLRDRSIAIR